MRSGIGNSASDPVFVSVTSGGSGGSTSSNGTVAAANPSYPVDGTVSPLSLTNKGRLRVDTVDQGASTAPATSTITTGGQAQTLYAANPARRGIVIQNQSTGELRIGNPASFTAGASLIIPAGGYYETPPTFSGTAIIQIIGATTGQAFYAREHS